MGFVSSSCGLSSYVSLCQLSSLNSRSPTTWPLTRIVTVWVGVTAIALGASKVKRLASAGRCTRTSPVPVEPIAEG